MARRGAKASSTSTCSIRRGRTGWRGPMLTCGADTPNYDVAPGVSAGASIRRGRVRGTESLQGRRRQPELVSGTRQLAALGALGAAPLDAAAGYPWGPAPCLVR